MPDHNMAHIAQRMFGTPLMIEPGKAEIIARAFGPRVFGAIEAPVASEGWDGKRRAGSILHEGMADYLTENRRGYIKHQGVAVIEVVGSLVRRGAWLGQSSGMTSYEGLRAQLKAAAADADIKAIALEMDTPGGEAAGAFELADLIREVREAKPVYAFCAEYAFSAGYALASQASRITVPEFGGAGSIGVIAIHAEMSAKMEKEGIAVTIVRAGKNKAEGNPYEPLPESLLKDWQGECEAMRVRFAELVGKGRGDKFSMAAALKTEARAFDGKEAVRLGLADQVADPKTAFDAMVAAVNETGMWDGVIPDPADRVASSSGCVTGAEAPQTEKEAGMPDNVKEPEAKAGDGKVVTGTIQAPVKDAGIDAAKVAQMVAKAGLSADFTAKVLAEAKSMEEAQGMVIDALAESAPDGGEISNNTPRSAITGDGVDRMKAGMSEALCAKAGLEGGKRNEFSSMSLREMARFSLQQRGLAVPVGGATQMVAAAFVPSMAGGLHGTSDFGSVLADVAHKSMLKGYAEAPETFDKFTKRGTLTDFKPAKRTGTGLFDSLTEVAEGAEFKYGTMGDFSESIVLATYGKLFAISRQAVINDDLGAFTDVPLKMGRAAKRTVGALVYAILQGNPAMSDGTALFHADHGNLAGAGAAPSEATIDAGLQAMAKQKPRETKDDKAVLNIQPKYLLAPVSQRSAVLRALLSEKAPDTSGGKGSQAYNTVYQAAEPIFDARLTGTAWYMAADPAVFDTIEVAYLDGISEPFLEQQDGWTVDGTEFKVRLDAGAAPNAWEGLYKNPGA